MSFVLLLLLFVLFFVLFVCKCVLPPGDNPTAVNKYIIYIYIYILYILYIISYVSYRIIYHHIVSYISYIISCIIHHHIVSYHIIYIVSYIVSYIYTGWNRRNVPDFGRVFLMLKCTDITQNTYIQS